MSKLKIEAAAITHVGSVRNNNEDNYFVNGRYKSDSSVNTEAFADKNDHTSYTYAVCDGMGGESYGELASLIAVATLAKYQKTNIRKTIADYIRNANDFICDLIRKNNKRRSGTTIALLNIQNGTAIAYNIGDSRVYFYRKGMLFLVSQDHVYTDENSKNKLTQYLGIFPSEMNIEPYVSDEFKLKKGDVFVLCSDGLTDMVTDDELVDILSEEKDPATVTVKKLAGKSQDKGGRDNVTVVVVKIN
ncbi:MAG: serine/threonine-protein phosphatase [Oscillospiraceae bacterium]|nr:serine/threonine-protein phosphatase [Oscillospiraceae bacterium]